MDDDFELEVTDLRTGRSQARRVPVAREPLEAQRADDALPDDSPDERSGMSALGATTVWKRVRAFMPHSASTLRGVVVAGAAALVVLALLASLPDSRASLGSLLRVPTPTATATLPAGADQFSAVNGVPWGVLLADGKRMGLTAYQDRYAFSLPRGRHTLEYRAAPFPTMRCVVSVPAGPHDTCPLMSPDQYPLLSPDQQFNSGGVDRFLNLGCTPRALSDQQRTALEGVVQRALDTLHLTTVVPTGTRYLGTDGQVHTASAALAATFSYRLNHDARTLLNGGPQDCVTVCSEFGPQDSSYWFLLVHVVTGWGFSSAGVAPFAVPPVANQPPDTFIVAQVTWGNGWHLADQPFQKGSMCDDVVNSVYATFTATNSNSGMGFSLTVQAAANAADGCLFSLAPSAESASTAAAQSSVYLYRFGLLFTVSAQARAESPQLPAANADEQALARHLATQPPG